MGKKSSNLGIEKEIKIDLIDRPGRVSRFEVPEVEIGELADSIRERGLLQAITVVERAGRYEVVFGDRRLLACKKLGMQLIRCVVREYGDIDVAVDRATENAQRANLSPLEEASEWENLHSAHKMSWEDIGRMIGKSPGAVSRRTRLLRMDDRIQRAVHERKIPVGVAEELHRCPDLTHALYLLEMCVDHGVTVEIARGWVNDFIGEVRRSVSEGDGIGGELEVYGSQPIFKACSLCGDPVNILHMRRIEACAPCHDAISRIMREGG